MKLLQGIEVHGSRAVLGHESTKLFKSIFSLGDQHDRLHPLSPSHQPEQTRLASPPVTHLGRMAGGQRRLAVVCGH